MSHPSISQLAQNQMNRIQQLSVDFLSASLNNFFHSLRGALFVLEQSQDSGYEQLANINSLRYILDADNDFAGDYIKLLRFAFEDAFNGKLEEQVNNQLIQLNESDSLGEKDIFESLINNINGQNQVELGQLLDRFKRLTGFDDITLKNIPFSPLIVLFLMQKTFIDPTLSPYIKNLIYGLFDINVLQNLRSLYNKVSEMKLLSNQDESQTKGAIDKSHASTVSEIADIRFKHIINHFDSQYEDMSSNHYISHKVLVKAADVLFVRMKVKNYNNIISAEEIIDALKTIVAKLSKTQDEIEINPRNENLLKLVEILFSYIKSDGNIPGELKMVLMQLQKVVYRAVIHDMGIFAEPENSLRKLLNKISVFPEGFQDNERFLNKYLKRINNLAESLLQLESYQQEDIDIILGEYLDFTKKQSQKISLIRKRLKEKEVGKDKINRTKKHVKAILDRKMTGRYMPVYIQQLLINDWQNALVLELLRNSEKSKPVESKIAFINDLLAASETRNKPSMQDIHSIVSRYAEGLSLIAFNPKELDQKKVELQDLLMKLHNLKKTADEREDLSIVRHRPDDNQASYAEVPETEGVSQNRYLKRAQELKTGDVLELLGEDNNKVRAKISWISPISGNVLLVNDSGIRIADKSPEAVAQGLKDKTIIELKALPLIDRVFLKVLKEMKF